jgi:hypothetical protein
VVADESGDWIGNEPRFATYREAEAYAKNLAGSRAAVRCWRVVESDDPVRVGASSRPR